jgi:hypothetical protein
MSPNTETEDTYDRDHLVSELAETVGEQKAASLIDDAFAETGVDDTGPFDRDSAKRVVRVIADDDDVSSLTTVAANTLLTRL